jgi:hypothetical protein
MTEALEEQRAVGEAGEPIVQRIMPKALLDLEALAQLVAQGELRDDRLGEVSEGGEVGLAEGATAGRGVLEGEEGPEGRGAWADEVDGSEGGVGRGGVVLVVRYERRRPG